MLATAGDLPVGPGWAYELKWDGVRALAVAGRGGVRLFARTGAEITAAYPELRELGRALAEVGVTEAVLDGEIVIFDVHGKPSFVALAERMHVRDPTRAAQLAATVPVTYLIFDVLSANGTDITSVPYVERRDWLESLAPKLEGTGRWMVPPRFADGTATVQAAKDLDLEGVVAKRLNSVYRPGARSPDWIKIKHEQTGDYVIGGWRPGQRSLGALLVGTPVPGGLRYRGRVGGGISAMAERDLLARLAPLEVPSSPFLGVLPRDDAHGARYTRPELVVEVRYGNVTPDGRLRFPRFLRLRPDKTPAEAADA
ncbi:MAG TPA: non-homologous end-joining DNA ligase [Micromonosporaceae bacterium]